MAPTAPRRWADLDHAEQQAQDRLFLRELEQYPVPGLTEEGVRSYLAYRRERPDTQITTYEEGQIRRMLRHHIDPSRIPDPVDQEEHTGWLENFGATRLHMTNEKTYAAVVFMMALLLVAVLFGAILLN